MSHAFQTEAEKALAQHVFWATGDWPEEAKRNLVEAIVAALSAAASAEREACAKIADDHRVAVTRDGYCAHGSRCLDDRCNEQIAKDIRARAETVK